MIDGGDQDAPVAELGQTGPHLQRIVLGTRLRKLREAQRIGRRQDRFVQDLVSQAVLPQSACRLTSLM